MKTARRAERRDVRHEGKTCYNGSGASHEYEWITGTGILRALQSSTTIIFR
jgi:hypothetical protein